MKKRTALKLRKLPDYTRGEEIMNMVTHIVGGGIGIIVLLSSVLKSAFTGTVPDVIGAAIYGSSMITVYTMSSVYHGLHAGTRKKVMQIIDHCAIYFLIAGTYTPILISAFIPHYRLLGWILLIAQWGLGFLAATLTAIDLENSKIISMVCYILMGWCIIFFIPQAITVLRSSGFYLLLSGGIAYTVGAILYGIGVKNRWMHSVFHIFVVIGSLLQYWAIYFYVL